jgi:hypothetical protein
MRNCPLAHILEAIAVPKHFRGQSFLDQLEKLRVFVRKKRVIGIK